MYIFPPNVEQHDLPRIVKMAVVNRKTRMATLGMAEFAIMDWTIINDTEKIEHGVQTRSTLH